MSKNLKGRSYSMTCRQPATRWQDALPTGNGTVGAMVYGNIRNDLVLLNHEALWLRTDKPELPDVSAHLPELRAMLAAGKYVEAEEFLHRKLVEKGYKPNPFVDPFHPACDLELTARTWAAFAEYRRGVDFTTGEVSVTWKDGEAPMSRWLFVSRTDDVVAMKLSGPADKMELAVNFRPHGAKITDPLGRDKDFRLADVPITFRAWSEGEWIFLTGRYDRGGEFGAVGKVVAPGGSVAVKDHKVAVAGAAETLVLVKLFASEPAAPAIDRLKAEIETLPADYAALIEPHAAEHSELFLRMTLDLAGGRARAAANDELMLDAYDGNVSALVERMFDFGRYLLICSSRPGGLPANLQGVWNGDYNPPWASDFHNDENIEMNYWQALPGNMPEVTVPFFDYYERHLDDYRTNAKRIYGCRGIHLPVAQSTHGLVYPYVWLDWTAGCGWLAQLYYDYYLFTGDRDFLRRRAVPWMKEVAAFYEDFLFEGPDGKLMFSPSMSPENVPAIPNGSLLHVNATMDVAVAKELLTNLCAACELLGIEQGGVTKWRGMLAKLPEYQVNEDGAIKEWIHPDLKDNYNHRHQSHIYPVFPGFEVTKENNPRLFEAIRVAVEKRLVVGLAYQSGWSFAHMANIYARLGEGDRALECLELISRAVLGPNLLTYHNDWRSQGVSLYWFEGNAPYQIDANFGSVAAVLEMLLFSTPGMIKLLPALPSKWRKGKAGKMLCRGGVQASVSWDMDKKVVKATLRARTEQEVTVKFPAAVASLACGLPDGDVKSSPLGPEYRIVRLPARKTIKFAATLT